jgi:hypothetical protein
MPDVGPARRQNKTGPRSGRYAEDSLSVTPLKPCLCNISVHQR